MGVCMCILTGIWKYEAAMVPPTSFSPVPQIYSTLHPFIFITPFSNSEKPSFHCPSFFPLTLCVS